MFNENLKIIRKAKGYTQEELAIKIHVVRQTISKVKCCSADSFKMGKGIIRTRCRYVIKISGCIRD